MFGMKRPCKSCPFRRSQAARYKLSFGRLREIFDAPAFQCHVTIDYDSETLESKSCGPQQCAGLMAVLHAENRPNTIMQVAERITNFDAGQIETKDTFESFEQVVQAHGAKD